MKCGPDGCPIVAFSDLTPAEQRKQRTLKAKDMSTRGFTDAQIAKQFGVSRQTITDDLKDFNLPENGKLKRAKTPGNPKGAGRPRGRKRHRQVEGVEAVIIAKAAAGLASPQIAAEIGVDGRAVRHVLHDEQIRREAQADPIITPDMLSKTAQEKLDAAIRQHKHQLELKFEQRVREEYVKRINDLFLPDLKQKVEQAQELFARRRGLMTKEVFNLIRRALHPDSRHSISDKRLAEAFDAFMALEKYLLDEKDSPTSFGKLPTDLAEWDKRRAAMQAATKTARHKTEHNRTMARKI